MNTRRDFLTTALTAIPACAVPALSATGITIGVQSYSFRDRPLDAALDGMKQIGFPECELWQGHLEPKVSRDELRKWRTSVSMDEFRAVRSKFEKARIRLYAYNYSFRDDFSDQEISRGFEMARALGVKVLTASSNVDTARRIDPFAAKEKIVVGMHNHSRIVPNEFARPEDFEQAMRGMSPYIAINLDIGHFGAAGFDPVAFIRKHHARIVSIHIKDRKANQGPNVPLGEGDTPIKQVLQLMKAKGYPFPANVEYEYQGGDTLEEVRRCFDYCKRAVEA